MTTSPSDLLGAIAFAADPKMKGDLSAPARALISALDAGVGEAIGLGKSLTEAGLDFVGSVAGQIVGEVSVELGAAIADIIGNVSEAIPFIGPVIKAIASVISFALSFGENPSETCARHWRTLPPLQTGSAIAGGLTVPADYFAPGYGIECIDDSDPHDWPDLRMRLRSAPLGGYAFLPAPGKRLLPCGPMICPSALGMALMQLTEGCLADLRWFDWQEVAAVMSSVADDERERAHLNSARAVRRRWAKAIRRDLRIASLQWQHQHPDDMSVRGLPLRWVEWFTKIRRGIEASWGPTLRGLQIKAGQRQGGTLDGGAALWMAYLDRLVVAFDRGHLSWDYAEWLFARQHRFFDKHYPFTGEMTHYWHKTVEPLLGLLPDREYIDVDNKCAAPPTWFWGNDPCPAMVVGQLRTVIENWRNSVNPYYGAGANRLQDLEQDAIRIGASVGKARRGRVAAAMKKPHLIAPAPEIDDTDDGLGSVVATVGAFGALALLFHALHGSSPRSA